MTGDIPKGVTFTQVAGGYWHSLGVGTDGHIYAWGLNAHGQLGDGTLEDHSTPERVHAPDGVTFTQVAAGKYHSVALSSEGNVYTWGDTPRASGQQLTPMQIEVPGGVTFTQISAGDGCTVGLSADGDAYNLPSFFFWPEPQRVQVADGVSFTEVAVGLYHFVAVASDGSAYAWGIRNEHGQLGNGTRSGHVRAERVRADPGVTFTHVSAGYDFSVGLSTEGDLYTWGRQHGETPVVDHLTPVRVQAPDGVLFSDTTAGGSHSIAVASDGDLYTWGAGTASGQLGDGASDTSRAVPGRVQPPDGVFLTDPFAANGFSVAFGSDGNRYAWGENTNGQLGDGTTSSSSTPRKIDNSVTVTGVFFDGVPGAEVGQSGDKWTATAPAGGCGLVDVAVEYTQYGVTYTDVIENGYVYGSVPVVAVHPASATIDDGQEFTLMTEATGDPAPSVRWQRAATPEGPWTDIDGATEASLTTTTGEITLYRAVHTNCVGEAATEPATITIKPAVDPFTVETYTATTGWQVNTGKPLKGTPLEAVRVTQNDNRTLCAKTYLTDIGWLAKKCTTGPGTAMTLGTTITGIPIESLELWSPDHQLSARAYINKVGWQAWKNTKTPGQHIKIGTTDTALPLEAIQITPK